MRCEYWTTMGDEIVESLDADGVESPFCTTATREVCELDSDEYELCDNCHKVIIEIRTVEEQKEG